MRILFLSEGLRPSGMTGYARSLLVALRARGHEWRLLLAEGGYPEALLESLPEQAPPADRVAGSWASLLKLPRAYRLAREFRPELIHALSARVSFLAGRLAWLVGLPAVATVHHFLRSRREISRSPRLAAYLPVSEALRENLVNVAGVDKKKLQLVPTGLVVENYPHAPSHPRHALPLVGAVGRLVARKGFDYLLRAAALLRGEGLALEIAVVGDGPELPRLQRLARELYLRRYVTFLPGSLPAREILPELDLFVAPSLEEALGFSILEAMACARAVVASNVGGIFALVREGETGYLVPPRDVPALAERIRYLLERESEREKLGRAGRERVTREFHLTRTVSRTEEVYRMALSAPPGAE